MNIIWELSVIDTIHYPNLCRYACQLYGKPLQIIHYDPDLWGIGDLTSRQIHTFILYKNTFGTAPPQHFWLDTILHIIGSNVLSHEHILISIYRQDINNNKTFYLIPIGINKTITDLINLLARCENTHNSNLKLIYNGVILDSLANSNIGQVFNEYEPIVHLLVRLIND